VNEKAKNKSRLLSPINFVLLWICLTVATTYAMAGVLNWLWSFGVIEQFITAEYWRFQLFVGLLMGGSVAVVQKRALQLAFGHPFNGWIRAHILGVFLGVLPFILQNNIVTRNISISLVVQVLASLPVAWVLRRYTKWSWSIVVTTLLAHFLLSNFLNSFQSDLASLSVVGLRTGLLALNLLWLLRESSSAEKAKVDAAESHDRLEDKLSDTLESDHDMIDYAAEAAR
jgi:hypothetical protein